ncbi:MMPL family transporter [Plantactinospora soyae]|uniref:RND superfamily putative drug exporter n=1 Tax=Plantactinospora soyae TaxID=1544732 RepID=A0A927M395_9ACTN|nr:MMPL family transporter [Plantactinospora soyae]MBE1485871.1 RND superfamily putative drug exporter [Plantactinospora soyae]
MAGWTDWVLRHRRTVVLFWLVLTALGGALAGRTVDALGFEFALPGQPGYEANREILQRYGTGGPYDPLVLTVTVPPDRSLREPQVQQEFSAVVERVRGALPGARVLAYPGTDDPALLADGGRTTLALIYPRPVPGPEPYAQALPVLESVAGGATVAGAPAQVTGIEALKSATGEGDRGVLVEVLLGAGGALVVLALVFGSLLAGVPLLVATVSILTSFLCLLGLTAVTDVSFVVQYLVALIGLGVAIDYALLIVMRWREERSHGVDNVDAVRTAMLTAGRSVVFSGVTVAVSLAALIVVPVPFMRGIGYGGLLIPLLSVAVATTLLPVLLARFGPRLEWPRHAPRDPRSARWARIATAVTRRPVLAATAATILLLALAAPVLTLRLGSPAVGSYPTADAAGQANATLADAGVPPGALRPVEVLSTDPDAVVERLRDLPGVAAVLTPTGPGWQVADTALVQVWTAGDPAGSAGAATVDRIRSAVDGVPGTRVGGSAAEDVDLVSALYDNTPVVLSVIVVLTLLLLARALRSVVLPIKALLLNVVSIGAAYGVTVLIWQHGWLTQALFGTEPSGAITAWVPIAVFAFLFGLSMDYELFILARIREEYDRHQSTNRAVVDGISYTGRLVTSASLILFLAFVALSTVPTVEVRILATALALGIAIDAVVVRSVLAPALVTLLDRANWWLPAPLAKLLRTAPEQGTEPEPVSTVHR